MIEYLRSVQDTDPALAYAGVLFLLWLSALAAYGSWCLFAPPPAPPPRRPRRRARRPALVAHHCAVTRVDPSPPGVRTWRTARYRCTGVVVGASAPPVVPVMPG